MQSQEAPSATPASVSAHPVDAEQAAAALVEHYPRLARLAYLVLPPGLGRGRRVRLAHGLLQRALPRVRGRGTAERSPLPGPRPAPTAASGPVSDPGYAYIRLRVLHQALAASAPRHRLRPPRRAQLPPLLPLVWGLRLFPRVAGHDELALDQQLAQLSGPARAAFVLRGLERLTEAQTGALLTEAGVTQPYRAMAEAARVTVPGVRGPQALLGSPGFDPCSLQARPTDVLRRRQHLRAALAAALALLVCGALLGLPGDGWRPGGTAPYDRNPATEAALDPARLQRAAPDAWRGATRQGFAAWPVRGELAHDRVLLGRALAAWARPGPTVKVSAALGTPTGGPPGPPRLLFAGRIDLARVVVLYDGLRVVRYAEPSTGEGPAALDFARVDGAVDAEAGAVVVSRRRGAVRYLTAPWADRVRVRDLRRPATQPRPVPRAADGVTDPVTAPGRSRDCRSWNALELRDTASGHDRLLTDLGELVPAHLTYGTPAKPREATGRAALNSWAPTACSLSEVRAHGVRSVNSWRYAEQPLPEAGGTAQWLCTRAETWRGAGSRVFARFREAGRPGSGAVTAKSEGSPACGPRQPHVLAGVLWKSGAGTWYLLAAGSEDVASVAARGGAEGSTQGNLLALPASRDERTARISGRLTDGSEVPSLR
ncbi:hypothetical protein HUT18_06595 [Streptomyces sp. NA04227]|uniref:hypothetical protein n=1 Tax=Streptomyces sp. NA04227 TaxID=2742136 RepID=UPI0015903A0B|nr:hypothetical protein [Streptomyces sp. NA04227]QKW06120.1 hypothetical protein HUT18_06595 [Streptomyces sp. NA04227]